MESSGASVAGTAYGDGSNSVENRGLLPRSKDDANYERHSKPLKAGEFKLRASTARTQAVLNVVCGIEGIDMQLMPASFKALQSDFHWALQDLGSLVFYQESLSPPSIPFVGLSVSQAISGLFWGLLADRTSRVRLLSVGCAGWGIVAIFLASSTFFWQFALLKVLNGVAMASIGPVAQSLIADLFPPTMRGEHFGWLQLFLCAGCILGATMGGSLASITVIGGVKGWRIAFFSAGVLSLFAAALVQIVAKEPRRHSMASLLTACPLVGGLLGSLFGGWLGDQAERFNAFHGRPLVGQLGTLLALPLIYIGLLGIPRRPDFFGLYAIDMLFLGFAISWCPSGVNRPILSEIVEPDSRATVFATQIAIEGSVSALLGSPVIALLGKSLKNTCMNELSEKGSISRESSVEPNAEK
ncbi:transmembrane domain-containing protein, putative [Eimeria maxima]|uniref:Transmembrane domain-containing protein, putative n=1 Tax=Eimeria maxima TaxID=5804 RepID=U6M969_EIMMA|nr:transmembrane domain-containing protein, putative [Eimeria maxima]CDJ58225.1 transmembrane domain-containing protein, putative [Eimeria maxima]